MEVTTNREASAPTLNLDFVWKPTEADKELLDGTVFFPDITEFTSIKPGDPLLRTSEVSVSLERHVLCKLEALAGWAGISVPHLVNRMVNVEVTQYGHFDLRARLQLVSTSPH